MKSKLKISAGILLVFVSIIGSRAQFGVPGGGPGAGGATPQVAFDPTTGMPISGPRTFDPATGQPLAQAVPDWKDSNWKDPDITLTNISYDNIPLSEVARSLSSQFKEQFDILLPGDTSAVTYWNGQMVPAGWERDWRSESIQLRLKNVTASEVFAAMNLLFENNRTPLHWELKVNGHRQIAFLRLLVEPTPQSNPFGVAQAVETQRRVYFVGNLIGDEKNGGMTMEQIIKTVTDVWKMADSSGGNIQFHKEAQLLVVTGTPGQIDFMEQTLTALGRKAELEKAGQDRGSATQNLKTSDRKAIQDKTNSGTSIR